MGFRRWGGSNLSKIKKDLDPVRSAIWLVSYPRSGNTFLRALLANYFSGLDRPLTLAEISASTQGEHREDLWCETTGKPGAERTVEDEWNGRSAYLAKLRDRTNPHLPLVKSHSVNGSFYSRRAFDFVPGDRIVHIVRHPCEVAVSLSCFRKMPIQDAVRQMFEHNCGVYGEPPRHGSEIIGSWNQHTQSWLGVVGTPVLHIRYFDLVADTRRTLADTLDFLGTRPNEDRVLLASAFSEFARMQRQEAETGFAEAPPGTAFFRDGKAFRWLWNLDPDHARTLLLAERDLLDRLGFTDIFIREAPDHFNRLHLAA
jgi:hypothetical protein